jgi:hypothetical protein
MVYSYGPMSIEKLTPDFLNSAKVNASFPTGEYDGTVLPTQFVEAPSLWKRGSTYYLTTGHCCCFCYQGSGMIVYTASHPLGPWLIQEGPEMDLGCIANASNPSPAKQHTLPLTAVLSPGNGCNYQGAVAASVSRAQQNFVVQIETPTGTEYVWTGDRWMQSKDGEKAHEPQFWAPLKFDTDGKLQPLLWVDSFTVDVLVPQPTSSDGSRT